MTTNYRNVNDILADVASTILRPPERISVSQAAERYRHLNNPGSYIGPWYNKTVPYMVEPMDSLNDRDYNAVIFAGPAQCAKTDVILNWILFGVVCDPADFILYQTSQGTARDFSKRRVDRLHRHSPEVGERLLKRRDADNTFDKYYKMGNMLTLSWPSINELSGRPVGRVALTDYDRMPPDVDGEGSPFDLARKRTTTFGSFATTFAESSPGYMVEDSKWRQPPSKPHLAPPCPGILALYNRGDRRRWVWPCPHCGHYYEPTFDLLQWVASDDLLECAESAQMLCPHCQALMDHSLKPEVNQQGSWIKEGQTIDKQGIKSGDGIRSDIASFWLKGAAASFASWKVLVINYLKAKEELENTGSQQALKSTVNTDQGEAYFPVTSGDHRLAEDLQAKAVDLGDKVVPDGVRFLIATIDVQGNRFEVQVHGVGKHLDIFVFDRFAIRKSNRKDEDGDKFMVKPGAYLEDWNLITEQVINKTYSLDDESGRHMAIKFTVCDSGGRTGVTANAYKYFRTLKKLGLAKKFRLVKGASQPSAPRVQERYPDSERKDRFANARGEIPVLFLNTNLLKDWVDKALDREEPGGGYIHFADWLPDEFFSELVAEEKTNKGWENLRNLRNEAWDLLAYCYAVLIKLGCERIDWDKPPGWAEEWEKNTLVAAKGEKRFEAKNKPSLSELGAELL